MAIPESQLEIWSHQGSITQSSTTYNSVKNVLEDNGVPYSGKDYEVFLQGSYGNSTNTYAESDVDLIIMLNDCFQHDLDDLPEDQEHFIQLNAELSQNWPVITEQKEPLPDAEEWNGKPNKTDLLEKTL